MALEVFDDEAAVALMGFILAAEEAAAGQEGWIDLVLNVALAIEQDILSRLALHRWVSGYLRRLPFLELCLRHIKAALASWVRPPLLWGLM